jgi:hypothetical protein
MCILVDFVGMNHDVQLLLVVIEFQLAFEVSGAKIIAKIDCTPQRFALNETFRFRFAIF